MPRRNAPGIAQSARKPAGPRPVTAMRGEAEPLDLSGVTRWVGPMLRIVQVRTFQNYYASDVGTSPGVLSSLTLIRDNPGIRHGVLADAMVVQRPNMTKLVGYLARNGLILRRASSEDGRSIALYITAKGLRLLERTDGPNECHEARITAALTGSERAELLRLLGKLASDLIDQPSWTKKG
jgi:DNA-binding MarR family transcriptional regulator